MSRVGGKACKEKTKVLGLLIFKLHLPLWGVDPGHQPGTHPASCFPLSLEEWAENRRRTKRQVNQVSECRRGSKSCACKQSKVGNSFTSFLQQAHVQLLLASRPSGHLALAWEDRLHHHKCSYFLLLSLGLFSWESFLSSISLEMVFKDWLLSQGMKWVSLVCSFVASSSWGEAWHLLSQGCQKLPLIAVLQKEWRVALQWHWATPSLNTWCIPSGPTDLSISHLFGVP